MMQDASEYRKRLPKGIVKEAELSISVAEGTITTLLSVNLTKAKKPSLEYWRDYITKNVEDLKQSVVSNASSPKTSALNYDNVLKSDDGNDSGLDSNSDEDVQGNTEYYSACSTSLSPIIRQDLSNQVRVALLYTIKRTLEQASDYSSAYSKHVLDCPAFDGIRVSGYLDGNVFVPQPLNMQFISTEELSRKAYYDH
ncbi:hypothetical protein [Parasitella parasitica]|uniref:Uncharacterized protein n=1 Tax=Parasitella parasitica TaxID=35722 RepID=A0A0B7MWK8_9FUNG|nr:hypothetical protein [Parasitella parasitica]